MKRNLLLFTLLISATINAQNLNPAATAPTEGIAAMPLFINDINGRPLREINTAEIEGHPFLVEDWCRGTVIFKDKKYVSDVLLQFDLHNNKLYFKRGEQRFEFVQPVSAFTITYLKGGDSVMVLYRNGYAAIDRNSEETFYELLAEGKYQLLRFREKVVQEFKLYNGPTKKKFEEKDQLYAFLPGGKFVKLKKDKESLIALFPQYAAAINQLVAEKKLKLKKDEDIAMLFGYLNLML